MLRSFFFFYDSFYQGFSLSVYAGVPERYRVRWKVRAAAEIMHLTTDEVERSASIGIKVRHIFLIFDVDGDQYPLSVTAPLPDCLFVGEQQLLKVAAVQRFVFPMCPFAILEITSQSPFHCG